MENQSKKICPDCHIEMDVLMFLGMEPEGYVCPKCNILYDDDLRKIATVIGG